MTTQIPDTLSLDGKIYEVVSWFGNTECIPKNDVLGIKTVSRTTSDHEGRIDHFGVWGNHLYLFKVEASLADPESTPLPKDARREILFRYEQMYDFDGVPTVCYEYRYDYFIYENYILSYSGDITVQNITDEGWGKPELAPEHLEEEELILTFENGVLLAVN